MKVTSQFLKNQNACIDGIQEFEKIFGKSAKLKNVILYGIKTKDKTNLQYCNWLIVRKMTRKQKIQYAIFAAEQVISIFEKKYPNDKRPMQAIKAAKKILKKNNIKNRNAADAAYAAADAAAYAADAAAYAADAAAYTAADAAAYAAYAAYAADAAYAAAYTAANAAYAAYAAYAAADAADAAWIKLKIKILKYGLKIIYKEN